MPYDANRLKQRGVDEDELGGVRQSVAQGGVAQQYAGLQPMQQAPAAGGSSGAAGPAPVSRFVNFGRRFALNKGGAESMAGNVAGAAEKKAGAANQAGRDAWGNFLSDAQKGSMSYSDPNVALPKAWQPQGPVGVLRNPGLQSESTRPGAQPAQPAAPGALTRDEVAARAQAQYAGPTSLDTREGWGDLVKQTDAAQQGVEQLQTPGGIQTALGYTGSTGNSRLDAGLTGVAGADQFKSLKDRYGGMASALTGANAQSKDIGKYYGDQTAAAAKQYGDYLGKYDQRSADLAAPSPAVENSKYDKVSDGLSQERHDGYFLGSDEVKNSTYENTSNRLVELAKSNPDIKDYWGEVGRGILQGEWPHGFTPPAAPSGKYDDKTYNAWVASVAAALRVFREQQNTDYAAWQAKRDAAQKG